MNKQQIIFQLFIFASQLSPLPLRAQDLMAAGGNGQVNLLPGDLSVLESQDRRKDIPCQVKITKPELGFDLSMHAGYVVTVPIKDLTRERRLLVIARVKNANNPSDEGVLFRQHVQIPEDATEGVGEFDGRFDAGEGKYHVDWLMRDGGGRVCSEFWDFRVESPLKTGSAPLRLASGVVQPSARDPYTKEPQTGEKDEGLPKISIFYSVAGTKPGSALLEAGEEDALASMLRGILHEPGIGKAQLVAFNLEQRKVLSRQVDQIDLSELKRDLSQLKLGIVDAGALADKGAQEGTFLESLLEEQEGSAAAVIFLGPRVALPEGSSVFKKKGPAQMSIPVFYLSYAPDATQPPSDDAISRFVKTQQGKTFNIHRPRDFFVAWPNVIGKIRQVWSRQDSVPVGE
jgi:hypothetical protein